MVTLLDKLFDEEKARIVFFYYTKVTQRYNKCNKLRDQINFNFLGLGTDN